MIKGFLFDDMSCYVCFDNCLNESPCKCKDRYVHPECLQMLKKHGYKECPVCLEPYRQPSGWPWLVLLFLWCIL